MENKVVLEDGTEVVWNDYWDDELTGPSGIKDPPLTADGGDVPPASCDPEE